jgi:hypothetical protein
MSAAVEVIRMLSDMMYVLLCVGLVFGVILLGMCALGLYEGVICTRCWAAKHRGWLSEHLHLSRRASV